LNGICFHNGCIIERRNQAFGKEQNISTQRGNGVKI
jgi:hypothetical protein